MQDTTKSLAAIADADQADIDQMLVICGEEIRKSVAAHDEIVTAMTRNTQTLTSHDQKPTA